MEIIVIGNERDKFHKTAQNIGNRGDILKNAMWNANVNKADMIISFNLQGFEQSTLAGSIAYNLLNCKQIHVLLDRELPNEQYLSKPLSISMFFYCLGNEYYNYLMEKYPDIPYLKKIDNWNDAQDENAVAENVKTLHEIIAEVKEICHLN